MLRLTNGESGLFRAVELIRDGDADTLAQLSGSGAMLVLTDNRISSLGRSLREAHSCATVPVANRAISTLFDIAINVPDADILGAQASIVGERPGSLADMTTRLLRIAKLIPRSARSHSSRDRIFQERLARDQNILVIEARTLSNMADRQRKA